MDSDQLAHFLRATRERVTPEEVGLSTRAGRRTPGLRREEVAWLASVSIDTYTRLEQARGACPSAAVLDGLARALRLDCDSRAHLFYLAGYPAPPGARAGHAIAPAILHLLERMDDTAALVLDAAGYVLVWNPLAAALIADFSLWAPRDRNLTWQVFCGSEGASATYPAQAWEEFARSCVADLRAAAARYPEDQTINALIQRLKRHSDTFTAWWDEHHVRTRSAGHKRLTHPIIGELELDFDVLLVPGQDQRIIIYSAPPDSPAAESLRKLALQQAQRAIPATSRGPRADLEDGRLIFAKSGTNGTSRVAPDSA